MYYFLLLLPTIIFLLSPLRIDLSYVRENKGDKLMLYVKLLWGLIKIPINLEKSAEEIEEGVAKTFQFDPSILTNALYYFVKLRGKLLCRAFKLKVDYSLGDAGYTGLGGGLLWSLTGGFLTFLKDYLTFKTLPSVSITPSYNRNFFFHVSFITTLEMRMYNVYYLTMMLMAKFFQALKKKIINLWQRKGLKEIKVREG